MGRIVDCLLPKVVSVSLGSSARDHRIELDLCQKRFEVSRVGCDGDKELLKKRLIQLNDDPMVAAIGLGGLDFFMDCAGHQFWFREIKPLKKLVPDKPFVGGGGLKVAFEKSVVPYLTEHYGMDFSDKQVLLLVGLDRYGLACGFEEAGAQVNYGDLLWALGLPFMMRSQKSFIRTARIVGPMAVQLPFQMLYNSNADHETASTYNKKAEREYRRADIIAGDYKFVTQHMPEDMEGKWVITNTTTPKDIDLLRDRGIELLVTTTPRLDGRSFGTNLIEACLIAAEGADTALRPERYVELAYECGLMPSVTYLR